MALDSTGLTIKRLPEISSEMNSELKSKVGNNVDTSSSSFIGNYNSVIANQLSQLWELAQSIYDAQNLYNAEGEALDNKAVEVGLSRKQATKTQGTSWFTGGNGVVLQSGTRMQSSKDDEFVVANTFAISTSSCLECRVYVDILENNTQYSISLDGVSYLYTSDADATELEILNNLAVAVDVSGLVNTTVVEDEDNPEDSYLLLTKTTTSTTMSVSGISYLTYDYVVTPSDVIASEFGQVSGDSGIINEPLTNVTGWYSVTNPTTLTEGSDIENDDNLRLRILTEFNTIGSGTVDSITTNLLRVDGVTDALVLENSSDTTDAEGIPPKSYECVVNGGLDEDIAEVVWETKPAGIYTHGDEVVTIVDFNGYDKSVRFSRPDIKYVTVRVQYDIYDEESFPSGAITSAKEAILTYAKENLMMGTDLIAKRFLGAVYGASTGFGDITIKVAAKDLPTDSVMEVDYQDTISISNRQVTSFDDTRVIFTAL